MNNILAQIMTIAVLIHSLAFAQQKVTVRFTDHLSPFAGGLVLSDDPSKGQIVFKAYDGSAITASYDANLHLLSASGIAKSGVLYNISFSPWPEHSPITISSSNFPAAVLSVSSDAYVYSLERGDNKVVITLRPAYMTPSGPGPFIVQTQINGVSEPDFETTGSNVPKAVEKSFEDQFPGCTAILQYFVPVLIANGNDIYLSAKVKRGLIWGLAGGGCGGVGGVGAAVGVANPIAGLLIIVVGCAVAGFAASYTADSVDQQGGSDAGNTGTPGAKSGSNATKPEVKPVIKPPQFQ